MSTEPEKCHLLGLWLMRLLAHKIVPYKKIFTSFTRWDSAAQVYSFLPESLKDNVQACLAAKQAVFKFKKSLWLEDDSFVASNEASESELQARDAAETEFHALDIKIKECLATVDLKNVYFSYTAPVFENTQAVAKSLCLDELEHSILLYLAMCLDFEKLAEIISKDYPENAHALFYNISIVLDCTVDEIRSRLHSSATLVRSGLVITRGERSNNFVSLNEELEHQLYSKTPDLVFDAFFVPATKTKLALADFEYYKNKISIFKTYLNKTLQEHQPGVNILLYGKPGVGKSELARILAEELKVTLYQVVEENKDKSAKDRNARLTAFRLGQEILQYNTSAMMLFDEVEDVFAAEESDTSSQQKAKGFVNRLLETNAVPTFWITNSCRNMDAAVLRRFDLILHMSVPAKAVREKIARSYFKNITSAPPEYLFNANITPADLARIAKVVTVVQAETPEQTSKSIDLLSEEYLKLYSSEHEMLARKNDVTVPFDFELCNCTFDFHTLTASLKHASAAVLLAGPEGTGKCTVARHIGEKLGVVVEKSAAELIETDPSNTVLNLRGFFEHLRRENAIGLLKNIDVMFDLSADTSFVNTIIVDNLADLLSRHTETIFVTCTSAINKLPLALQPCFEVKTQFDYLIKSQIFRFIAVACGIPVEAVTKELALNVSSWNACTPQAFITVLRRAKLFGVDVTPHYIVKELATELAGTSKRTPGFC